SLPPENALESFNDKFFERDRTPPEIRAFGAYLYVSLDSSYRKVSGLLGDLSIRVSHVAVWSWVQRIGERMGDGAFHRKERRVLVADETKIKAENGWIYVFAAMDPENREIVGFHVSEHRESIDVLVFLRKCLKHCKNGPKLITDGGPWHLWPAQILRLDHVAIGGEDRNYIERWFGTLKDRLRIFDVYFPTAKVGSIVNFMRAFCYWYNESRYHLTLKGPPMGGEGGFEQWIKALS
ncbi:hypothetical protein AKJ45_03525, partial [candidate division MSBL1 archaeon SCGC-AAA261F19]